MSTNWIDLGDPPLIHQFSKPKMLNNNEIIMCSQNSIWDTMPKTADNYIPHKPGIYKYDIIKNKSSLLMAYSDLNIAELKEDYDETLIRSFFDRFRLNCHTMSLDKETETLYVIDGDGTFLMINLKTKEDNVYIRGTNKNGIYLESCFIDGQLHIIGGHRCREHLIWNKKDNKFHVKHTFNDIAKGIYGFHLNYVKSRKSMYLFGGIDDNRDLDSIYIYSLIDDKWSESQTVLPFTMNIHAVVITADDKYAVILCNDENGQKNIKQYVYILDLDEMEIIKTKVELPDDNAYFAVITNNYTNDELLVFGYIEREKLLLLPLEINQMILKWYSIDYIYLFIENCSITPKWKIAVQDIMNQ